MVSHGLLLPTRGSVMGHTGAADLIERTQTNVLELAQTAESEGFDAVWVGDSVLAKPRHEPLTTLAGLASVTQNLTVGTAVYLPTLRHPVNIAHQVATITHVGDCQVALGVGVGRGPAVEREYGNLGSDYPNRGPLLDEALDIMTGLWAGESVSYDGEFYRLDEASLGFEPGHIPQLYIPYRHPDPERGFPRRIRERIAAHAGGWLPIDIAPDQYAAGIKHARAAIADAERDPNDFDAAFYLNVVIAETERDALDQARQFLQTYYPRLDSLTDEEVKARGAFGPAGVIGDRIDEYVDAGVETLVTRFTTVEDQRAQLEAFVDEVL